MEEVSALVIVYLLEEGSKLVPSSSSFPLRNANVRNIFIINLMWQVVTGCYW